MLHTFYQSARKCRLVFCQLLAHTSACGVSAPLRPPGQLFVVGLEADQFAVLGGDENTAIGDDGLESGGRADFVASEDLALLGLDAVERPPALEAPTKV